MHARGQHSRCTWVGALPHLVTLENGDEDHQPRSGSAPAARAVLLPQIAQHSEHGHQLCSPSAVCVACAGFGARAVRCARCWLTCKRRSIGPTRPERRALQSRLSCDAMSRLPAASSSAAQPADLVTPASVSPLQYDCAPKPGSRSGGLSVNWRGWRKQGKPCAPMRGSLSCAQAAAEE